MFGTQNFTEEECCFLVSDQSAKQYKLEAKSSLDGGFTSVKQTAFLFYEQFTLEALDFFTDGGRKWASVLLEVSEAKVSFSK